MISKEKPADFNKRFDVVGCFILHRGKFLMLHRHPHKASGDAWGLPAGKVEPGEDLPSAMCREVKEETGIELTEDALSFSGSYYVRDGDFDIEWHMFSTEVEPIPSIVINPHEHSEFRWLTREEALKLKLIHDMAECMEFFFATKR